MHDQSPIDLPTTAAVAEVGVSFVHPRAGWQWRQTAFTLGAEPVPPRSAGTMTVGGSTLPVVELHTHRPSEHTWDGAARAGEVHVVHRDGDAIAVLGIGLVLGSTNPAVQDLLEGEAAVSALLPPDRTALTYVGSTTTPPFAPDVRWVVLRDPLELSGEQLQMLVGAFDDNAREVQPLGDRIPRLVTPTG